MTDASPQTAVPFASAAVPPVEGAHTPVPGSEGQAPPSVAPAPVATGAPVTPTVTPEASPLPDPAEVERLRRTESEYTRLQQQMQQQQAQFDQQQRQQQQALAEQQHQKTIEDYVTQAEYIADQLPTREEQTAYRRQTAINVANAERAFQQQQRDTAIAEYQQREYAWQLTQFPDYLGKQFNLTPKQVDRLRDLNDDKSMLAAAKLAQTHNEELSTLRAAMDQSYAQQQAQRVASNGTFAMGSAGPVASGAAPKLDPNTSEAELDALLMRVLGIAS